MVLAIGHLGIGVTSMALHNSLLWQATFLHWQGLECVLKKMIENMSIISNLDICRLNVLNYLRSFRFLNMCYSSVQPVQSIIWNFTNQIRSIKC